METFWLYVLFTNDWWSCILWLTANNAIDSFFSEHCFNYNLTHPCCSPALVFPHNQMIRIATLRQTNWCTRLHQTPWPVQARLYPLKLCIDFQRDLIDGCHLLFTVTLILNSTDTQQCWLCIFDHVPPLLVTPHHVPQLSNHYSVWLVTLNMHACVCVNSWCYHVLFWR